MLFQGVQTGTKHLTKLSQDRPRTPTWVPEPPTLVTFYLCLDHSSSFFFFFFLSVCVMLSLVACLVVSGLGLSVCGIIRIRLHVTFRGVYQRDTTQMAPCCLLVPTLNLQQEDELTLRRLWWFARCRHMDYKCTVFLNNPNNHLMRSALFYSHAPDEETKAGHLSA